MLIKGSKKYYIESGVDMLDIMKMLVVSSEKSEYENIRNILNPLKAFELNYANNIECNSSDYDLIIADLDSFNNYREMEILKKK